MKIRFKSDDDLPLGKILIIIHKSIYVNVCMSYKMLQYERIDVPAEIGINKSNKSKECIISHIFHDECLH